MNQLRTRKKVLMIAQFVEEEFCAGNSRFTYLADMLSEKYDVLLISSSFHHAGKKQKKHNNGNRNFVVHYVKEPGYTKNVSLQRLYSHTVFGRNLRRDLTAITNVDLVYCAIPSVDAAMVALDYAKSNGIPFMLDVQDIWPEAFQMIVPINRITRPVYVYISRRVDSIYKRADCIVAVSETYLMRANKLRNSNEGIVVYLGTSYKNFMRMMNSNTPKKPEGEYWVIYVGTLGHSYDVKTIIDAMGILRAKGYENIKFIVIGDGPLQQEFEKYANHKNVNVFFFGRLPYKDVVSYLGESDVAVNPIVKKSPGSIINKHGDYAMAGLPVISTQEGHEYKDLLETYKAGKTCDGNNPQTVAAAIEDYYLNPNKRNEHATNSRRLGMEKFDREHTYKKIVDAIDSFLK